MPSIQRVFDTHGPFLRRRDLLRYGFTDRSIGRALRGKVIFRVRHGWYARPSATDASVHAIRVGGKLTGRSALETYGLRVPHSDVVQVVVPLNACRLRRPRDKSARLTRRDGISLRWTHPQRSAGETSRWRVSVDEALLDVLRTEPRDIAVACCDAVMRYLGWNERRLNAVFSRAPRRARAWRALVVRDADSHGESFVRLWCTDAGIRFVPQPKIAGVGRLDGRISPRVFVEIDGIQHDEREDERPQLSQFEKDHRRDTAMAANGDTVLRFSYRQILAEWPACLAAMRRSIADDLLFAELLARHPIPKRRSRRSG